MIKKQYFGSSLLHCPAHNSASVTRREEVDQNRMQTVSSINIANIGDSRTVNTASKAFDHRKPVIK